MNKTPQLNISISPQHVSIVVAVFALLVSALSLYESHTNRVILESTSSAYVSVTGVQFGNVTANDKIPEVLPIVTNSGKVAAHDVLVDVFVGDFWPPNDNPNATPLWQQMNRFSAIAPGGSVLANVLYPATPRTNVEGFSPDQRDFYVFGTIKYTDTLTGKTSRAKWCYSSTIKPDKTTEPARACPAVDWLTNDVYPED